MKKCNKCKVLKPLSHKYFHKDPKGKRGLTGICSECRSKQQMKHRLAKKGSFLRKLNEKGFRTVTIFNTVTGETQEIIFDPKTSIGLHDGFVCKVIECKHQTIDSRTFLTKPPIKKIQLAKDGDFVQVESIELQGKTFPFWSVVRWESPKKHTFFSGLINVFKSLFGLIRKCGE